MDFSRLPARKDGGSFLSLGHFAGCQIGFPVYASIAQRQVGLSNTIAAGLVPPP
jgi:hypothetical protein